jgi:tetratricopeptide (TPR) repeat protein
MRKTVLIFGCLLLCAGLSHAQSVPDAPQPQKKPVPKTEPAPPDSTAPAPEDETPAKPAAKDDNAFPEDVSRAAAKTGAHADGSKAASPDTQAGPGKPAKDDNAFPEDVSRAAAKAAQDSKKDEQDQVPPVTPKPDLAPGESSSQSSSSDSMDVVDAPANELDPVRAKKDIDVGSFYLKSGNLNGALQRYKDASAADPTNVEAIFGLAETQRLLKHNTEAVRDYQMYLDILPNGPRAKQALKALKMLSSGS